MEKKAIIEARQELAVALHNTRQHKTYLSLEEIAEVIKYNLPDWELLAKKLHE